MADEKQLAFTDSFDRFARGAKETPTDAVQRRFRKIFDQTMGKFIDKALDAKKPLHLWSDDEYKGFRTWALNKSQKIGRTAAAIAHPDAISPDVLDSAAMAVFRAAKKCKVTIEKGSLVFAPDERGKVRAEGDVCGDYLAEHS